MPRLPGTNEPQGFPLLAETARHLPPPTQKKLEMVLPVRTQSAPATPSPAKIWGGVGLDGEKWKALLIPSQKPKNRQHMVYYVQHTILFSLPAYREERRNHWQVH